MLVTEYNLLNKSPGRPVYMLEPRVLSCLQRSVKGDKEGRRVANAPFISVQSERFHEDIGWQSAKRIVRGDVSPAAPLPAEGVLMGQFGVSRAVVREALRSLEQRGLVTMRQGRRTVVAAREAWDVLGPVSQSAPDPVSQGVPDKVPRCAR